MKFDLHNHVVPPTIVDAIAADPSRYGTKFELKDGRRYFSVHGPLAELTQLPMSVTVSPVFSRS